VVRLLGSYDEVWRLGIGVVPDLYAPEARLTDSILGLDVSGVDAVAALATLEAGDQGLRSSPLPGSAYVSSGGADGVLRVWVLHPRAGPCEADTVLALGLDPDERIVTEQRYHALDALAACTGLREPDDGWWVGRDVPEPFGERVTGTIHGPAGPVQIRNGGPAWQRVVGWSLDQFTRAGLPAPEVAAVTFDPLDLRCTVRCGWASSTPPASVLICVDAAGLDHAVSAQPTDSLPLWPTHVVLHELAHVWIDQHLHEPTRHRFVEQLGLTSWNDPTTAWDQRGNEWAADTMAWGLIDRACTLTTLGAPPCDQLTEAFHTLTGVPPLTPCPAPQAR
jgi:hypothetical protein